jgi:hypothetical protein
MRFLSAYRAISFFLLLIACGCGMGQEPSVGEKAAAAAVRGVDRAKTERTLGHLEAIRFAMTRYQIDQGGYPEGGSFDALAGALTPRYMPRVEPRDAWGHSYSYSSDGSTYTVSSPGEDGAAGTEDDVTLSDGVVTPPASFVP